LKTFEVDANASPLRARLLASRMFALVRLIHRSGNLAYRRDLGLSEIEWGTLSVIGDDGPLCLNELAELMERDRGQLSRCIMSLETKSLVSRVSCGGRGMQISLTDAGIVVYQRWKATATRRNAQLTDGLTDEEIDAMIATMTKCWKNASRMLESAG
jgi:DNA-binding MarR family transcriptional regulator